MSKNYYDILGVSRNATEEEIKRAFKKKSVLYHPDRWSNKSEAEQKNAEEKFKEVNEAKEVLLDADKRSHYDRFGTMEGFGQGFGGFSGGGFGMDGFDMGDIFEMFTGRGGRQRGPKIVPGDDIKLRIPLSLEDIWKGYSNNVEYVANVRCEECHGEGGTCVEKCKFCNGTGMVTETQQNGFTLFQSSHVCGHCHGTGKTIKNKCTSCGGTGFKRKHMSTKIDIPAFAPDGGALSIRGKGSESKDKNAPNGDLIVIVSHSYDQEKYRVVNDNIFELYNISYYDALLGKDVTITLPDGQTRTVHIPKCCKDTTQITVDRHYKIVVNIKMPTTLNPEEERLLKEIKSLH